METLRSGIKIGGVFEIECYDKLFNLKWRERTHNVVSNEAQNKILDIVFHGGVAPTSWFCALVEGSISPTLSQTYAVPLCTESSAYDEATRPEYNESVASGQMLTNSANKAVFTINATKTMYGAMLVGGGSGAATKQDKVGSGGVLYCYGLFSGTQPVVATNIINLTYAASAADDGV